MHDEEFPVTISDTVVTRHKKLAIIKKELDKQIKREIE
jgi:hypothetical protein